jgi:lysophospholipase L1-like esterase
MDRRSALSLLAMGMLGACGGGGSAAPDSTAIPGSIPSGALPINTSATTLNPPQPSLPAPQPSVPAPPQAVAALSRNIACWGDSLSDLYWSHLQKLYPDRQVFDGGVVGDASTQIEARAVADTAHRDWISVYWYGHNDFTKAAVPGNIAASIAALNPNNKAFIVMSLLNWADNGERGTAVYDDIVNCNNILAAQYPDNFIDIHAYLVSLFNPNDPQDVQDHNNDLVPTSLRFDRIHLNDTGCDFVAAKIKEFITNKGW